MLWPKKAVQPTKIAKNFIIFIQQNELTDHLNRNMNGN